MQANGRIGGTPMPTNQESSDAPVNFKFILGINSSIKFFIAMWTSYHFRF